MATMCGLPLMLISEEEAQVFADSMAKVIASSPRAKPIAKRIEKDGPGLSLALALATIYGPRLFILYKLWKAQREARPRPVVVMSPKKEESAEDETADPQEAPRPADPKVN
jgi:hypothetical protein